MKKVLFIVAVAISLTACNSASTEAPATTDSTSSIDSTNVIDSVAVKDSSIVDTLKK